MLVNFKNKLNNIFILYNLQILKMALYLIKL